MRAGPRNQTDDPVVRLDVEPPIPPPPFMRDGQIPRPTHPGQNPEPGPLRVGLVPLALDRSQLLRRRISLCVSRERVYYVVGHWPSSFSVLVAVAVSTWRTHSASETPRIAAATFHVRRSESGTCTVILRVASSLLSIHPV